LLLADEFGGITVWDLSRMMTKLLAKKEEKKRNIKVFE
jgi:hypothetical protein